jgi:hypothetical protein
MKNEKVLELLKDGPMTSAEISEALGICAHHASSMMLRLIKENRKRPQLVHIKTWVTDHKNQRRYPRALYELGEGPNARKPKPDPNARKREYEARKRSILKTSSVFNLAVPLKCLRSRSTPGTKTANSASNAST